MKVLIVDDRLENIRVLELMLRRVASETASARDGEEALRKLRSEPFDAMLTDIMMPRMDGFQLCHAVRAERAFDHIAIVFVTATYTDPKDEAFAQSLGADGFFVKPLDPETFPRKVSTVVKKRAENGAQSHRSSATDDVSYWKDYALRIVRKLEDKVNELEVAHTRQRMLSQTLELRVQERTASLEAKTKELEARSRELEASNRELEAFAYSVSHDLRSPLRSIEGFSTALYDEYGSKLDDTARQYFDRIRRSAQQMDALLRDLLAYSRVTTASFTPEAVDVSSTARSALELLTAEVDSSKARIEITPHLPLVLGHRATLQQVLFNLISNGIKFVSPGVQPQVRISQDTSSSAGENNRFVRIRVEDNGIGIPSEYQHRIFNLFERLHARDAYPGTGLGLAIVRRAIERMGGKFGVTSNVGHGSCFWFELPRAPEFPANTAAGPGK